MYRYTVMTLATLIGFVVIFTLLDLVFGKPLNWVETILQGVVFALLMTGIQVYKERKKNKQ